MKRDVDYVTMADYEKDQADLVALSANIHEHLKAENEQLKALIGMLIHAVGKIEVPDSICIDSRGEQLHFTRENRPDIGAIVFTAEVKHDNRNKTNDQS